MASSASRGGFRLRPLKLTGRQAGKKKKVEYLYRGNPMTTVTTEKANSSDDHIISTWDCPSTSTQPFEGTSEVASLEPTCYELESRASILGWEAIRNGLLNVVTELAAMPHGQTCINCGEVAVLKCMQCGSFGFYCTSCFEGSHQQVNFMHVAEKWEIDHYVPFIRENVIVDVRPQHICDSKKKVKIKCIDENGKEHTVFFCYCGCEELGITLARAELWPATPKNPKCAFSFLLLDRAETLLVEAQVSLKDFCNTLNLQGYYEDFKGKNVYSNLINSFEEYRFLRHELRNMTQVSENLGSGNVCPACPQDGGSKILSMDALFGLPRKKSAGVSFRKPLFENFFFYDQSEVDLFVSEYTCSKQRPNPCSNFQAGNVLRSAKRYKALDETAVFGYCCRHEIPGKFINLKHGEKLAYGVFLLEKITEGTNSEIFIMYDIACSLSSHLKKLGRTDILEATHICLPAFHCYGHKLSCQIQYSPRRCTGLGLSDGEGMERLWSYLRRFHRTTKEMRPSHRIDVLSGALEYYVAQKKSKLASLLLRRWDRCKKVKLVSEESLQDLIPNYSTGKDTDIEKWIEEEVTLFSDRSGSHSALPQWKLSYFLSLQMFYSMRLELALDDGESSNFKEISSLDRILQDLEMKHHINRWLPSDPEYLAYKNSLAKEQKEQMIQSILNGSQRRAYLLQMKAKYADGQKIAKRLCSQIAKETRLIKSLLNDFNESGHHNDPLTLTEAFNPDILKLRLQSLGLNIQGKVDGRREIIQAYLTRRRSEEEMELLMTDANNTAVYYSNLKAEVMHCLCQKSDSLSRGRVAMLWQYLAIVDELLRQAHCVVEVMSQSEPYIPTPLDSDSSSESDLSDDDYD